MELRATIWVVRAGVAGRLSDEFEALGYAGLACPPARDVATLTTTEIADIVCAETPTPRPKAHGIAAMVRRFALAPVKGDLVVTPTALGDLLLGAITGDYHFSSRQPEDQHVRSVSWHQRVARASVEPSLLAKVGAPMAFFKPAAQGPLRVLFGELPTRTGELGVG